MLRDGVLGYGRESLHLGYSLQTNWKIVVTRPTMTLMIDVKNVTKAKMMFCTSCTRPLRIAWMTPKMPLMMLPKPCSKSSMTAIVLR